MNEITYLSDEELLQLMEAAESELQPAPPDLAASVLAALDDRAEHLIPPGPVHGSETIPFRMPRPPRSKRAEFAVFCAQVVFTAAAAVAIVIGLSLRPNLTPTREEVLRSRQNTITTMMGQSYLFNDYISNHTIFGGNTYETK